MGYHWEVIRFCLEFDRTKISVEEIGKLDFDGDEVSINLLNSFQRSINIGNTNLIEFRYVREQYAERSYIHLYKINTEEWLNLIESDKVTKADVLAIGESDDIFHYEKNVDQ